MGHRLHTFSAQYFKPLIGNKGVVGFNFISPVDVPQRLINEHAILSDLSQGDMSHQIIRIGA